MRKEAVLSSKIEGTQASLSDLFVFEASHRQPSRDPADVFEVDNYVRAMEHGLARVHEIPLSIRLLREMHGIVISEPTKTPGELRRTQNWIGTPGCTLIEASYVPPPPGELPSLLGALEQYWHESDELPALIRYAEVHYQFEAIHPFLDGNGRVGRLLITLLLCADPTLPKPLLSQPLLFLSAYFERNRQAYYEHLMAVSTQGAWREWALYFLRGIEEQAVRAAELIQDLLELHASYRLKLHEMKASALVQSIAGALLERPIMTLPGLASETGHTFAGVKRAVGQLMRAGILSEAGTKSPSGARLYVAREVLERLEA